MTDTTCEPRLPRVIVVADDSELIVTVVAQLTQPLEDEEVVDLQAFLRLRVQQLVEEWDQ